MKNYLKKSVMFFAGCVLAGGLLLGGPKEGICFMEGMESGVAPSSEVLKVDDYKVDDYKKSTKPKEKGTTSKPLVNYSLDINYLEPCAGCPGLVPGY